VIAVFGAGPVGQFAGATDVINFDDDPDIVEQLKELTGARGPDAVIDAVGMEAVHGHGALTLSTASSRPLASKATAATRCATRSSPAGPPGSCRSSA
jgi:threonine dehydrogenase-like Zn-dependent dehydrogenase